MHKLKFSMPAVFLMLVTTMFATPEVSVEANVCDKTTSVKSINKINPTTVQVGLNDGSYITFDFYGDNVFRMFHDVNGGILRDPSPAPGYPEAQILVDNPRCKVSDLALNTKDGCYTVSTSAMELSICTTDGTIRVKNIATGKTVFQESASTLFKKGKVTMSLKSNTDEFYYGGGVQNGRFSHRGKIIAIENQNSWTDGGVASPAPFFWSTAGYGLLWHTFAKGSYDFGATQPDAVLLSHETDYLDVFFMIGDNGIDILRHLYQLTGNPVLIPKFGFYEGHLNAYNRDYWVESDNNSGVLFEDGKRYRESQKDNGGVQETLNGEKNNYQFSARAVIDRYEAYDMPLGWILPNDGYGAGYGQTETLDGNINNLKEFGDYARERGVEIGLWTESNLHPREGVPALLQRDLVKEVRDAGVRVLKTDVAWVGAGYSFGLNGVTDAAGIMTYYGNNARPFIISLDGWAGTQRFATIWSGDQTGGDWEYIRFHIPTYIGAGLSGQPNITSDMDGIFGGKHLQVNIRDYQWKTYTPMELNMDGWGANEKYPHALGEPATSINRMYLKMKSELMPYAYSIAREAVYGKPMVRAMFLEDYNPYTLGTATKYQYMYGPYLLVAPIYQETAMDKDGNDVRNGIYLPQGTWYDWFSGDKYEGGCILNNYDAPLWKLPVLVKAGAIIPMNNPHNRPAQVEKDLRIYELYPSANSCFTEYDDDGVSELYKLGEYATTIIDSKIDEKGNVTVVVNPVEGSFSGMVKEKSTLFRVNMSTEPKKVTAKIGTKNVKLVKVFSKDEFDAAVNVYYYDNAPRQNRFATTGSDFAAVGIVKNPQLLVKLEKTDVTASATVLEIKGYEFNMPNKLLVSEGALNAPQVAIADADCQAYTLTPSWQPVENADYYEIMFEGRLYTTIKECKLLFEELAAETEYEFDVRAANKSGVSDWTHVVSTTKSNPLEFAITGVTAYTTCENQGGQGANRLFDFEEGNIWHTKYGESAVPFELVIDLGGKTTLDKLHYLGREDGGNGTILEATIQYSTNKNNWSEPKSVKWERTPDTKLFIFDEKPLARYVKINVTKAVGNFGSGREMYIFKVPGTETYIPGDINKDKKVDENDLTSYMNYTGLRSVDSDFDYISVGDINENALIDAYDISVVATTLDEGANGNDIPLSGNVELTSDKNSYKAGEQVVITVKGCNLQSVNAVSLALPYNAEDYEFVMVQPLNVASMQNFSKNRLHGNGDTAVYPTFVNVGDQEPLSGNVEIVKIVLKAKRNIKFNIEAKDIILVDKALNALQY